MTCDHCHVRPARINTAIDRNSTKTIQRLRCWLCYGVEQKINNTSDWHDTYCEQFAKTHDMIQRENETKNNLQNRCKRFVMQSGIKL